MRALDTNVLVRLLVGDNARMEREAQRCLDTTVDRGELLLVLDLVLIEILWVLRSMYGYSRVDILDAIERLTLMSAFKFESWHLVRDLIDLGRSTTTDLSDLLIGLVARRNGCVSTLTFDKKASRSDLFQLLGEENE